MQHAKPSIAERAAKKFYWTAKKLYKKKLQLTDRAKPDLPILVYTMGKVGSTSITDALSANLSDASVYHVHFLTDHRLRQLERARKPFFRTNRHRLITKTWEAQYVADLIKRTAGKSPFKVISLVRDPVGRNISDFFQHLDLTELEDGRLHAESYWYGFEFTFAPDDVGVVIDNFFQRYDHTTSLEFFDAEVKAIFKEAIYARPFPREAGFDIYRNELAQILIIRLEDLRECAVPALEQFLELSDITIPSSNRGEEKKYARLYSDFKKQIKFPESYLSRIYGSKMARHFYSDEEIENFRKRWLA